MTINSDPAQPGFERYPYRGRKTPVFFLPFGILLIVAGIYAGYTNAVEGEWLTAAGVAWFAVTLGMSAVGVATTGRDGRQAFRYINAVVMTRSERAPVDSWVHVAPTKPVSAGLNIALLMAAIGVITALVVGMLQLIGVMPRLNADGSTGSLVLAVIVMAVVALGLCALSYLNLARAWRSGRFGARPSGITLGEKTVSVRVPGREGEIAWNHIVSVRAIQLSAKHSLRLIELKLLPEAEVPGDVQMLSAQGYTVPIDALWTALRWYHAHPESQWELGRIEAERRIEGWRQSAVKMR